MKNKTTSKKVEFNTPYGKQPPRCFFETTGESLTQQQFTDECDIQNILRSHDRNGVITHIHKGNAIYGDFSNITDFSDALEQIKDAQESFMNIPSEIREKFKNDAGEFFKFASNSDNEEEMREMGLIKPLESVAMSADIPANPDPVDPPKSEGQD